MSNRIDDGRSISRRLILKSVPAVTGALAAVALAGRQALAQTKLSHADAKYQDSPKNGQQCSTCVQFLPPSSCKIVADPISPNGQFYAKKTG